MPEVAAGWPKVTDAGARTRSGSGPATASRRRRTSRVTAESFRHEIERFLSPKLQPGPWSLAVLADVVGATAYHAGHARRTSPASPPTATRS